MTVETVELETSDIRTQPLRKTLGRLDIVFLSVGAIIAIDTVAAIASLGGAEAFTWTLVIGVTFLFPYAMVIAELGSAFHGEGGPFVWVRLAFGKLAAAIATMFYWITNPLWMGGSLVFVAVATWSAYISPIEDGSLADYVFKLTFIWLAIYAVAIARVGTALRRPGIRRTLDAAMGTVLIALGLRLAAEQR